jgi:hypothetical protein
VAAVAGRRLSEGLGVAEPRAPVTLLALERCDRDDEYLVWQREVDDRELELSWDDATGPMLVRKAHLGELRCQGFCLLDRSVELRSQTRAHCREVADLVEILFARFFQVAYGSHRWYNRRA